MSITGQLPIGGARIRGQKLEFRALDAQTGKSLRSDTSLSVKQRIDAVIVRAGEAA